MKSLIRWKFRTMASNSNNSNSSTNNNASRYLEIILLLTLLLLSSLNLIYCKRRPPLLEDRTHRKPHRSTSECQFGKLHKELGSTWYADLGPPFGVMYCIKCECIPVTKRNRIIGRVECRNIAKDCKELTCEDQIQIPGHCCKICRNDTLELTEMMYDVNAANTPDEDEKSSRHFGSLLTSAISSSIRKDYDTSKVNNTAYVLSTHYVATARFILYKRNLYFSITTNAPKRPTNLHFLDSTGSIIEEQVISSLGSFYQNETSKLCGVWRRLSREYRRLLREEKLILTLIWGETDSGLSGRLSRYRSLTTEIFSSLMQPIGPDTPHGSGATAIVSMSTVTPSVHVMVVFAGLVSSNANSRDKSENSFTLRLQFIDSGAVVIEETVRVDKPSSEGNVLEISTGLTSYELESLSQQKINIILSSAKYPQFKIEGRIIPKISCELFQAVLFPEHNEHSKHPHKSTRASGISWMFIDKNSMLQYYNTLDNVPESVIELVTFRHLSLLKDLTPYGLHNGSGIHLSTKQLELLYSEELSLNVANANNNNPSLIRGQLISRPIADSRDSGMPYLMKRSDTLLPVDMAGMIWASIDNECYLHYDLTLTGAITKSQQFELYLEDIPIAAPGAPTTRRLLEEFNGHSVEGYIFGLAHLELLRLETGIVYLDLWDMKQGHSLLRTQWKKVTVPDNCVSRVPDSSTSNNIPSPYNLVNDENEQTEVEKCYHGSVFYDQGAQWTSAFDKCIMCNCNHGLVKCDAVVCPAQNNCSRTFTKPGFCCPTCTDTEVYSNDTSTTNNICTLGGQTFIAGSTWHPYIPPNGFDTCTTCTCEVPLLKVKCRRMDCPLLNCDEKLAYRPDKKACCKICPSGKVKSSSTDLQTTSILSSPPFSSPSSSFSSSSSSSSSSLSIYNDSTISDQQQQQFDAEKNERDVLSAGGCKYSFGGPYENGNQWHPKIYSHGIVTVKCVTCKCKDGKVQCERKKCSKYSCSDPCCMNKSKCIVNRHRRHLKRYRQEFLL